MLWFMRLQGVGHDLVSKNNNNKELVSSDPQKSNLTFLRETMALIIASGMLGKSFNMCTSEFFFFQNLSSKETHLGIRQILIQIRPLFSRPRVIFLL